MKNIRNHFGNPLEWSKDIPDLHFHLARFCVGEIWALPSDENANIDDLYFK